MPPKLFTLDTHFAGVGVVPQHQTMGDSYDYDASDSVYNLSFDSLVDFTPNFNTVIVDDSAILTDFVSSAPIRNSGFIVSERVRALLADFNLPMHRFYDLPVTHRGSSVSGYSWLHLPHPDVSIPADASTLDAESTVSASCIADCALFRLYRPSRFAYCYVRSDLRQSLDSIGATGVRFGTPRLFR
ncbi:hypothetical protein [Planctomycetes bacterium CA13]